MTQLLGHESRIVEVPDPDSKSVRSWVVCGCGWQQPISTSLRANTSLVARVLYLEHIVQVLTGPETV